MQFDVLRAFPYPVLRPHVDDYIDGAIQTTVYLHSAPTEQTVTVEINFAVSVPEICNEIVAGNAQYVVVFSCRDTFMRRTIKSNESKFSFTFDASSLRGELLVLPFIVASCDISNFRSRWINPEFGEGPFTYLRGSLLAEDEPQMFFVDRDNLKPISSSFVLVKDDNLTGYDWRVDPTQNKLRISTSATLKAKLDIARNTPRNQAILLNSLYFAAVMQALAFLRTEEYEDCRWAGIFRQRCSDLNIDIEKHDDATSAQRLMKAPIGLIDTYFFSENNAP